SVGARRGAAYRMQDPAQVSGTLVSWGYGTENPVAAARVDAFKAAYPNVDLQVDPVLEDQKLLTAVASDTVPDLLWLDRFATAGWASREVFTPLADFVERDGYDTGRFYESAVNEASYEGQLYGIPGGMDLRVLYVNLDALAEAGVDPASLDTSNWDQLNELGAQLVRRNGDQVQRWGFDNKLKSGYIYLWGTGNGGSFMNDDGTETTFDDPKIIEALTWGAKTFDDQGGYQSYDAFSSTFQGDEQFARGQVAMTLYENWMLGIAARVAPQLNFRVLPIRPRGTGDGIASFTGGRAWYIPQGAKNPEAAWEFIKFMHTDETWLLAANALKAQRQAEGQPFIPTMTGSRTADQVQLDQVYEPFSPGFDEAIRLFPEVLAASPNREIALSPAASLLNDVLESEGVLPALRKEKEPQQALEDADLAGQDEIDSL
ncbi:MAG: ABC transporter substrate-binding protein, partial [Chloroflexota bacterium]|nr:ABC transporter substrate-binding protein [Chloroflexota bacterium]